MLKEMIIANYESKDVNLVAQIEIHRNPTHLDKSWKVEEEKESLGRFSNFFKKAAHS